MFVGLAEMRHEGGIMQRPIKFRAKETKTGRLIYSDQISAVAFWGMWFQGELDLETVGQYTGLKDKNEVEIYEGDIAIDYLEILYTVVFEDGCWIAKGEHGGDLLSNACDWIEAIGKICENKALLNGSS